MKRPFQQLVQYPYEVVRAQIRLIGCERRGRYDKHNHECMICADRLSCIWLKDLQPSRRGHYPPKKQLSLLEHAIDCMVSDAKMLGHDPFNCACRNCSWIRDALDSYRELVIRSNDGAKTH